MGLSASCLGVGESVGSIEHIEKSVFVNNIGAHIFIVTPTVLALKYYLRLGPVNEVLGGIALEEGHILSVGKVEVVHTVIEHNIGVCTVYNRIQELLIGIKRFSSLDFGHFNAAEFCNTFAEIKADTTTGKVLEFKVDLRIDRSSFVLKVIEINLGICTANFNADLIPLILGERIAHIAENNMVAIAAVYFLKLKRAISRVNGEVVAYNPSCAVLTLRAEVNACFAILVEFDFAIKRKVERSFLKRKHSVGFFCWKKSAIRRINTVFFKNFRTKFHPFHIFSPYYIKYLYTFIL